jgi:hypothetical protein
MAEIFKKNHHQYLLRDYWFWRDSNGHEVDLLTKRGLSLAIFEIKSTQTILPPLFKGMDYFASLAGNTVSTKTLIYGGMESQDRTHYQVRPGTTFKQYCGNKRGRMTSRSGHTASIIFRHP